MHSKVYAQVCVCVCVVFFKKEQEKVKLKKNRKKPHYKIMLQQAVTRGGLVG